MRSINRRSTIGATEEAEAIVWARLNGTGITTEAISITGTVERLEEVYGISMGRIERGDFDDITLGRAVVWID